MSEIWQLSATELAHRIADRQLSSVEVVDAHLARIDAVNPALNAVVRVLADEARAGAVLADKKLAAREAVGPLHGVPFTVKENIDMAGLPTTWGVPALAQAVVPADAPVVERMRAAGAIPIARTNLPDMALRVHTSSSLHGLTRNPWHPGRTAGGSSGGEAAALASGMSPIGLGNDIGGSLRNPANACGIASIRPSAGRVPDAGYVPAEDHLLAVQLMNVQGPMARRVADVRLGLRILMGAHPRDPWSIDAPFDGPPLARPIRVAVLARAAWRQHRSQGCVYGATGRAGAGRRRLCRGRGLPATLRRRGELLGPPDHGRFRFGAGHVVPDDGRRRDSLREQLQ
jgi:amidase